MGGEDHFRSFPDRLQRATRHCILPLPGSRWSSWGKNKNITGIIEHSQGGQSSGVADKHAEGLGERKREKKVRSGTEKKVKSKPHVWSGFAIKSDTSFDKGTEAGEGRVAGQEGTREKKKGQSLLVCCLFFSAPETTRLHIFVGPVCGQDALAIE